MDDKLLGLIRPETLTGVGIAFLVIYQVFRQMRKDRADDRRDGAEEKFRTDLMTQAREAAERADRFAKERNDALIKLAQAEANVKQLTDDVAELRLRLAAGPGREGA